MAILLKLSTIETHREPTDSLTYRLVAFTDNNKLKNLKYLYRKKLEIPIQEEKKKH